MSGPVSRDGGGREGDGDNGLPRVPHQREQDGRRDGSAYGPPPRRTPAPCEPLPHEPSADEPLPHERLPHERPPREPLPAPYRRPAPSPPPPPPHYDHSTLKSLLGAWALAACSQDEALAVETHLTDCAGCAEEALRLRDAVGLLHQDESLDLDPLLRARVLEGCLGRRPARIPVPEWAGPYDAEAARLDALLRDLGDKYWKAPVALQWFEGAPVNRQFTVAQVIAHLTAVDGLVGRALGLSAPDTDRAPYLPRSGPRPGPAGPGQTDAGRADAGHGWPGRTDSRRAEPDDAGPTRFRRTHGGPELPVDPWKRTAAHWAGHKQVPGATLRSLWREQTHSLVRTVSFAGRGVAGLGVEYGGFALPLRDAFVDRAFECWIHAADIAQAVDYPYDPPAPRDLNRMVDLAARLLPDALAERRRAGLTTSPSRLVAAGTPGRSLLLEVEGDGGGLWYLPLDSPGAPASADGMVAHVALDSVEFCQLAAGHIEPERIAVGQRGDRAVIRDVLFATASLSRL